MKAGGGWRSWAHCGPAGDPLTRSPLTTARSPRDSEVVQRPAEGEKKRRRRRRRRKSRKRRQRNWSITDEVTQEKQQGAEKRLKTPGSQQRSSIKGRVHSK